jgi:hypothetical protein
MRSRGIFALLAAAGAGSALAAAIATAGPTAETVTLGSTSGTPSANICPAMIRCTYLPYTGVSNPALQVPFDGTATSFSVNSGSAGAIVELRVLRPAGGGQFTGAGTSSPETLSTGVNTFVVSLPVKAGDLLGLDNDSSALIFDTSSATAIASYYQLPALSDGATAAPNQVKSGYRLLLSATVTQTTTSTTTTSSTTTSTTTTSSTTTSTTTTSTPPTVTRTAESNRVWRAGKKLAVISRQRKPRKPPVGTTFSFKLNELARVTFSFTQRLAGRKVNGRCVAQTKQNRSKHACKHTVTPGTISFSGHPGVNKVVFQGRISRSSKLEPGAYTLQIAATNATGQRSRSASLTFTIVT